MDRPVLSAFARLLCAAGDLGLARSAEPELLDGNAWTAAELRENLSDMARVNRELGGVRLTIGALGQAGAFSNARAPLSILDVGTGGADIPLAVLAEVRRRGLCLKLTAVDSRAEIVDYARRQAGKRLSVREADAMELPFRDEAFDYAMCSLLLHHFSPEDAVRVLAEMGRVARRAVVINDLIRNRVAYLVSHPLCRLATRNRLTRHDGPLSVARAYTLAELLQLFRAAGLTVRRVSQFALYRTAITAGRE